MFFVISKKASDIADHKILIENLEDYRVKGVAKDWFISHLKGRKQFVVIENETSATKEILTGVQQGLVLGPLLFNTCIQFSKTHHFADDTSILRSSKSFC